MFRIEESVPAEHNSKAAKLRRFFSLDSGEGSFRYPTYLSQDQDILEENLCRYDFILKLAQLFVGMISLGIYSTGIRMVPCDKIQYRNGILESRMTSMMFPNIVFSAFSIITSVIALSYILKQTMSEVLIRIFNAIGAILYFVSGCVTGYMWYLRANIDIKDEEFIPYVMFCSQVITTFINSLLYGLDVGLSLRKSWNIKC